MVTPTHDTPSACAKPTGRVRIVAKHEYKRAAATLAQAFEHDAVARYFVDTPSRETWSEERKRRLHTEIIEYITYAHLLKGMVTCCDEDAGAESADSGGKVQRGSSSGEDGQFASVALWMPPFSDLDTFSIFRSGLWRLYYKLCAEGRTRFFTEFFPLLHDTKADVLGARDAHSWYLVYIGTRPEMRGRGHARRLLGDMLGRADGESRAVYLESSNVVNEPFYRSLGFEAKRVIAMTRMGEGKHVEMNIMVREPQDANASADPTDEAKATSDEASEKTKGQASNAKTFPKVELHASADTRKALDASKRGGATLKAYAMVKTNEPATVRIA